MTREEVQELLVLLDYILCMDRTVSETRKQSARRLRSKVAELLK